MKRMITTAMLSVLVFASQAQFNVQVNGGFGNQNRSSQQNRHQQTNYNRTATLSVSSFDNATISVLIDGNIQSGTGPQVNINFQQAGSHHLSISKVVQNRWGSYLDEIYNGYVNVQAGTTTYASVDSWGQLNLGNNTNSGNCHNNNGCSNRQSRDWQNNYNRFMDATAFAQLKQSIQNKSFDSSKEQVAMQAMNGNNLSAAQVRELLDLFSFESTKLKVAKEAFLKSQDRNNFYVVNDAFSFSSTISKLDEFISRNS